jgi:hypothetical protein
MKVRLIATHLGNSEGNTEGTQVGTCCVGPVGGNTLELALAVEMDTVCL